jgi:hypothetical protein
VRQALARLPDHPLVAVVGPSGLGKSSFVRAGLMPALRGSGEAWEVLGIRPGRQPLSALAGLCHQLEASSSSPHVEVAAHEELVRRLRAQPGYAGTLLRARARRKGSRVLLFVDQLEELYTLVPDAAEREAFTSCLLGIADDAASPLRVVVSMRSDFLDRVAESPAFSEEMTRGLLLLPPLSRGALEEALVQPAELAGHRFEDAAMVETMLDALEATPGALSLLQFAAARLWEGRDRARSVLTRASYEAMGGIAGTLAAHADATLAKLAPTAQKRARAIFVRLVTPERTRAIVDLSELRELAADGDEVVRLVNQLVASRLLVTDLRGGGGDAIVELVHESLITSWPTLRRWLDESEEDSAFVSQLREVARQWDVRGRPAGLLWRGSALEEAQRFSARYRGELPAREQGYLDAALALATRSARRRRAAIIGTIALLSAMVVGATVALITIREAEQTARRAEQAAKQQAAVAETETTRAQAAERTVTDQLALLKAEEAARRDAESKAMDAAERLTVTNADLATSNERLQRAAQQAQEAARAAAAATAAERESRRQLESLLDKERDRVKELERQRGKIIDDLR